MSPLRLKLTRTVMSMGLALNAGGGRQQRPSLVNNSLRLSTGTDAVCADALHNGNSSAATSQMDGLLCGAANA
jgi:hypothetical protein